MKKFKVKYLSYYHNINDGLQVPVIGLPDESKEDLYNAMEIKCYTIDELKEKIDYMTEEELGQAHIIYNTYYYLFSLCLTV